MREPWVRAWLPVLLGVVAGQQVFELYIRYPDRYIEGAVNFTLQAESLVRCLGVCISNKPWCYAVNVQRAGAANTYDCEVLVAYTGLLNQTNSIVYFQRDMYINDLGYTWDRDRLMYFPPAMTGSWHNVGEACRGVWGELVGPTTAEDWTWYEDVFLSHGYKSMFVPIKEKIESDNPMNYSRSFKWVAGPKIYETVNIEDDVPYAMPDDKNSCYDNVTGSDCDWKDCIYMSKNATGVFLTIGFCTGERWNFGFVCQAGIPHPATYQWPLP